MLIFLQNNEKIRHIKEKYYTSNNWVHFSIIANNNSHFILKNNDLRKSIHDFVPINVTFLSSNKTYWKQHKCNS